MDTDMFVVRSLDELRRHETSLGLPLFEPFGAQFIATAPNSTFIRMYRDSYRKVTFLLTPNPISFTTKYFTLEWTGLQTALLVLQRRGNSHGDHSPSLPR